MGSHTSKHHKATSPYSSWGHSFDDLFCGPGQICADEWTPLPSRTQSLSPPRRRHSVAVSPGGAEVYTVRRKSFNGVIDEQPLPIEGASIRSSYHVETARSRRRASYHPDGRVSRPVTSSNPKVVKKKKKKKKIMKRVDSYPMNVPVERVPVHRYRSKSKKKSSTIDNRPPWRDVLSPRSYQNYLDPGPIAVHEKPPPRHRSFSPHPQVPPLKIHRTDARRHHDPLSAKTFTGSGSGSKSKEKIVATGHKIGLDPPPAFRVKGVPDQKYQRIPTMATFKQ